MIEPTPAPDPALSASHAAWGCLAVELHSEIYESENPPGKPRAPSLFARGRL
jgi:hypothetical protein